MKLPICGTCGSAMPPHYNITMSIPDKKRLVRDLCDSIAKHMCDSLESGDFPSDWDGHDIREALYLIAQMQRAEDMRGGVSVRARRFAREWGKLIADGIGE